MADTNIEWTDATWNPVTGCSKVSPGCKHCYAETVAERFWATQYPPMLVASEHGETARPRQFTDVMCHEDRLDQPLRWRKPRRIFVNSMSDLFHEDVPDAFIDGVFAVMAMTPEHSYQILTKRAERMREYASDIHVRSLGHQDVCTRIARAGESVGLDIPPAILRKSWPLPNVWLGTSVEDQPRADERIPLLLQTPAAVRFISCEPLLEQINFKVGWRNWLIDRVCAGCQRRRPSSEFSRSRWGDNEPLACPACGNPMYQCRASIDWCIMGGESGPKARPCDLAWVRSIVQQCKAAGVACFVKQLGTNPRTEEPTVWPNGRVTPYPYLRPVLNSRKGGDPQEWPADVRIRQCPCA